MLAKTGRGRADAHVQRLPCSAVLQRRSPEDGLEKCRVGGRFHQRSSQGHLWATREVAGRWKRRRVGGLVARGPAGVPEAKAMRIFLTATTDVASHAGSARMVAGARGASAAGVRATPDAGRGH